jgi:hypothetical protein
MPRGIFASYHPFDTLDEVSKLSHGAKLAAFEEQLRNASVNMGWAAGTMGCTDWIGFFAVPEYYFLKKYEQRGREVEVELYSESEMNDLVGRMISLSDQYSRVVILPGTMSWRRPIGRTVQVRRMGKDVPVTYDGISTAPAFYGGNQVASYDKKMNDGTIDQFVKDTRYVPGQTSPLFEVAGLKCGIEICGDFNEGNLAKATGPQTLDFEFMMSGTNYHMFGTSDMDKIPVRNGGYFLHVDQAPKKAKLYNGVWCVSRGSGWHGINADATGGATADPWTGKTITNDRYGQERSVGHVIALVNTPTDGAARGLRMPGARPHEGLRIAGHAQLSKPLDTASGHYEVTVKVTLVKNPNSTSPIDDRTVAFKAPRGQILSKTRSDANGVATAVVRCDRQQPVTITAEFHGATFVTTASMVWLGPGEVTKIATLKGTPHTEVPTYFTPV